MLAHYSIGRTIGKGTFGKVKLGTHTLTGEKVAVKILEKEKIKDTSDVERVSREIKILKLVRHPNVISLYEIIETPKQLYLIMEYACGGELFNYIVARTRLKESQACLFLQQLLSGVEYLQRLGVVHRDLKPENLLLDENNNLKIVDFGLSNLYKSEELLKTACGSPCYAAPEMIAGKRYHGSRVDVWSCGVVLFAMLCGYLPFEDPNTSSLYKKILGGEYRCGAWVSAEAQDILKKILNTNPEGRYTVEMIRNHPWYLRHCNKNLGPIGDSLSQGLQIDENTLRKVEALGLNLEATRDSLLKNKHNKFTSTYLLLLKKGKNEEAAETFSSKIAVPQPPANPRGDSHSINPRLKKLFEFKDSEKFDTPSIYQGIQNLPIQTRMRETQLIKPPAPRRKIYCNNTTDRGGRAVSTGYPGVRNNIPREPQQAKPSNRRNFRPAHVRTPVSYNDTINSLNVSIRNQSPRAGTALDLSVRKY